MKRRFKSLLKHRKYFAPSQLSVENLQVKLFIWYTGMSSEDSHYFFSLLTHLPPSLLKRINFHLLRLISLSYISQHKIYNIFSVQLLEGTLSIAVLWKIQFITLLICLHKQNFSPRIMIAFFFLSFISFLLDLICYLRYFLCVLLLRRHDYLSISWS